MDAIIAQLQPQLSAIQGAIVFPYNLPRSSASATPAVFSMCSKPCRAVAQRSGRGDARSCSSPPISSPARRRLQYFRCRYAQVRLDVDRDKAQVLGVRPSEIFNALQSTFGGFYVNDLNLFGAPGR